MALDPLFLQSLLGDYLEKNSQEFNQLLDNKTWAWCHIPTKLGILSIHVFDDWIACRFVGDLEPAKKHWGIKTINQGRLNPYSGKWNWHWYDVSVYNSKTNKKATKTTLKALAAAFIKAVDEIKIPVSTLV